LGSVVAGYAANDERDPDRLGRARVDAVVAELVARKVDPGRLVAETRGMSLPLADNRTVEGRQMNRRVDFRVLEQTACATAAAGASP
jgi:OOP family OmpA-OmpF porin